MKTKMMDVDSITISKIHNLESITIRDLGLSLRNDNTSLKNELLENGNTLIIPMVSISYDGANILVLTSKDKNFNYFVNKVKEVYLKEKDGFIEGSILKRKIDIDEESKKILLSDTLTKSSDLYNTYESKDSYELSLMPRDKEIKALLPLIEHIISDNLSNVDKKFTLDKDLKGYAPTGRFTLSGYINGEYLRVPIYIKKDNNKYYLRIGNVFEKLKPLDVVINFERTSLDIISSVDELNYSSYESFKFNNGKLTNLKEIHVGDKCLFTDSLSIGIPTDAPVLANIDNSNTTNWFKTSWNAYLGFIEEENRIDDSSSIDYRSIQYIDTNDDVFINIQSAEKRFNKRTKDQINVNGMIFDEVDKKMVGYKNKEDDLIYIETKFNENSSSGDYKEKYANRYFYHVSNANSFDEINNTNTISISRECDVYNPGDLIGNHKVRKVSKGK